MSLVPHELSEFEKLKHHLTHIPFQPWWSSCNKGKAQAELHKRTERITEDSELPVIQCDYLMFKDVATESAERVCENIRVRHAATVWAVKMLNFFGLSDIILQCDLEPSCPNRRWSTAGQQRTSSQSSRPHRSRGRRQPMMQ